MYAWLRLRLSETAANRLHVLIMPLLIALTLLLAGFPESNLRYARL